MPRRVVVDRRKQFSSTVSAPVKVGSFKRNLDCIVSLTKTASTKASGKVETHSKCKSPFLGVFVSLCFGKVITPIK